MHMYTNSWHFAILVSDVMPLWNGLSEEWCKLSDKILWPHIRHYVPVSLQFPLMGLMQTPKDFMCSKHSSHSCCSSNDSSHIRASNVQYNSTRGKVATYVNVLWMYCSITTTVTTSVELLYKYSSTTTTAATSQVLCNHAVQQQWPLLLKYCARPVIQQPQ